MENTVNDLRNIFVSMDSSRFKMTFDTEEKCLEILASAKWQTGFVCHKCGGTRYSHGKTLFARRCSGCKKEESVTAHTIFHHCRISLPLAFEIAYLVCGAPEIAASNLSQMLDTRHMTCLKFKKRILECVASHGNLAKAIK